MYDMPSDTKEKAQTVPTESNVTRSSSLGKTQLAPASAQSS